MKPGRKRQVIDSKQREFAIIWYLEEYPFRLRAGDVLKLADGKLCRVVRVNYSSAVVVMNRPVREFKTRFDKAVRFQPPPHRFYISPHSECEILNRKVK
jgi:hypothetical protein